MHTNTLTFGSPTRSLSCRVGDYVYSTRRGGRRAIPIVKTSFATIAKHGSILEKTSPSRQDKTSERKVPKDMFYTLSWNNLHHFPDIVSLKIRSCETITSFIQVAYIFSMLKAMSTRPRSPLRLQYSILKSQH
jgi:hypothetical protein